MDRLIKKLIRIAKKRDFPVFMISCDKDLFGHSHTWDSQFFPCEYCSIPTKHISIHYYDKFSELAILAHEVGHVITDNDEDKIRHKEIKASRWALQWLKDNGIKGLGKFVEFYDDCLKSYKA